MYLLIKWEGRIGKYGIWLEVMAYGQSAARPNLVNKYFIV